VKLWNAETGSLLATYFGHKTGVHTVAINRDGTLVASGGRDGAVRIWKVE
jgi:WD40 repeat protein